MTSRARRDKERSRSNAEDKLRQECVDVLKQLHTYFGQPLHGRPLTRLLADMIHLQTRIEKLGRVPLDVAAAMAAVRDGAAAGLRHIAPQSAQAARAATTGDDKR